MPIAMPNHDIRNLTANRSLTTVDSVISIYRYPTSTSLTRVCDMLKYTLQYFTPSTSHFQPLPLISRSLQIIYHTSLSHPLLFNRFASTTTLAQCVQGTSSSNYHTTRSMICCSPINSLTVSIWDN